MNMAATDPALVRLGRYLRDNPVVPLLVFLLLLIAALEIMRPGIVTP